MDMYKLFQTPTARKCDFFTLLRCNHNNLVKILKKDTKVCSETQIFREIHFRYEYLDILNAIELTFSESVMDTILAPSWDPLNNWPLDFFFNFRTSVASTFIFLLPS